MGLRQVSAELASGFLLLILKKAVGHPTPRPERCIGPACCAFPSPRLRGRSRFGAAKARPSPSGRGRNVRRPATDQARLIVRNGFDCCSPLPPGPPGEGEGEGRRLFRDVWNSTPLSLTGASRYCPRRTANRPGSQRMARHKITDFLQSASAGRQTADGDRPRSGVSIEMRPSLTPTLSHRERENPLTLHERCGALGSLTARRW